EWLPALLVSASYRSALTLLWPSLLTSPFIPREQGLFLMTILPVQYASILIRVHAASSQPWIYYAPSMPKRLRMGILAVPRPSLAGRPQTLHQRYARLASASKPSRH